MRSTASSAIRTIWRKVPDKTIAAVRRGESKRAFHSLRGNVQERDSGIILHGEPAFERRVIKACGMETQ
jgi:hypothetical protein